MFLDQFTELKQLENIPEAQTTRENGHFRGFAI